MISPIEQALTIALVAHWEQTDKADKPYILHPLRVMSKFKSQTRQIVAVLHDVIEDGDVQIDFLKGEGFSQRVIDALIALTHRKDESYEDYIDRVSENRIALSIKIADLQDNMNLSRIANPTEKDYARLEKYKKAHEKLWNCVWKNIKLKDSVKAVGLEYK